MDRVLEEYGGQVDIKPAVVFGKLFLYISELCSRVHILPKELLPCGNTVSIKGIYLFCNKVKAGGTS